MNQAKRTSARRPARVVRRGNRPNLEVLEERRLLATVDWISTTSGDWNNKSNWSTGQVPGTGDDVVINVSGASPTVTISSGSQSVQSLQSTDPLSITGGSLTVGASSEIDGALTLGAGTTLTATNGSTLTLTGSEANWSQRVT